MILRLLLILAMAMLSACASRPLAPITLDPATLTHWQAEGKMGLRVADRGGNLSFTWSQEGESYTLALSGPLGAGRTELAGSPDGVILRNGELGELSASSPEVLLEAVTGYSAPVSYLAHWLKAKAATTGARIERDTEGRPLQIAEDGWIASFPLWDEMHPGLPRKILITGPDTRLTVVILRWQTGTPDTTPGVTLDASSDILPDITSKPAPE